MNILNYNTMCFNEVPEFDSIRMFTTKKDNIKTSEQIFNDTCMIYDINKERFSYTHNTINTLDYSFKPNGQFSESKTI